MADIAASEPAFSELSIVLDGYLLAKDMQLARSPPQV